MVQGDAAAGQVAAAIRGFNALGPDSAIPRPDVLIVARGGGSVEDLWPFNDEALARTVSQGQIPLISAVGHETDTTLIDFVSDRRAPTPTAAAEMATPVLAELRAGLSGLDQRLTRSGHRMIEDRRTRLAASARGLPRPADLTAGARQQLDFVGSRLTGGLRRNLDLQSHRLAQSASPLRAALLGHKVETSGRALDTLSRRLTAALVRTSDTATRGQMLLAADERIQRAWTRLVSDRARALEAADKLRLSLDPKRPLRNGFALVTRPDGALVRKGGSLAPGDRVSLTFEDASCEAVIGDESQATPTATSGRPTTPGRKSPTATPAPASGQGDLF
jgi:exodeoxyribonuclease VII large subunit